jgi:Tfp pilus assembly protein PilF
MKRVLFIIIVFVAFASKGQVKPTSKEGKVVKAENLFKEKNFREALYEIKVVIKADSTIAKAYNIRGNCYNQINQQDSAEIDYKKAISLDKTYSSPYYNLGNHYLNNGKFAEALRYLRVFTRLEPKDADGWVMMAEAFAGIEKKDSVNFCYEMAVQLEPLNIYVLNHFGWAAFQQSDFKKAIEIAHEGMQIDSITDNFYKLGIASYYVQQNYKAMRNLAEKAIAHFPDNTANYYYKASANILAHTLPEIFNSNTSKFKDLHSFNTSKMDEMSKDPSGKYFFPTLLSRFKNSPDSLGMDEYFMIYYGNALQEGFSSMKESIKTSSELYKKKEYEECLRVAQQEIDEDPSNIDAYFYAAISDYELKNYQEYSKYISIYHYFMMALTSSGNGQSFETAFIVTNVHDEYIIVDYLGFESAGQSLQHKEGHAFDILHTTDKDQNNQDLYFNIDKHWESLSKSFGSFDSKEKKAKKKNKK